MKRLRLCLILTVALLLFTGSLASADRNTNPGILPPNLRVQGLTYGEWSATWWQYLLAIPASENPLAGNFGPDCFFAQIGNVGLVPEVLAGDVHDLECEVPAGMPLFVHVLAAECSTLEPPPFYGGNEDELRTCASGFVASDVQASIDGVAVQNLSDYLIDSPLYEFTVPEDNILGVPAGSVGQSVSYGTFLMLAPLTPGEHTIHVYGKYGEEFTYDATFHIGVMRGH